MTIDKLKPGMTVFDVQRRKMGRTTLSTIDVYAIYILDVDPERGTVCARWNGNPAETYFPGSWRKWRLKAPMTVRSALGSRRLATREEIKAAKAKEAGNDGGT